MLAPLVFDSPFLASTVEAVERRGKAIRYHGTLECSRELDRDVERLNIDLKSSERLLLRLSVWSDGAFWFSVNKPGPRSQGGWQIDEQIEGTLGECSASEIVQRLEQSMIRPTHVASIWSTQRI